MAERDRFERDLALALHTYAEDAPTEVRPAEVARRLATTHPHRRSVVGRWGLGLRPGLAWALLVSGMLLALVVGGLAAGAWWQDRAVVIVSTPSASPSALPTPSPSPSVLDPATATWTKLGPGGAGVIVAFDVGYVQLSGAPASMAYFSADGLGWEATSLAVPVPNCPAWGAPGDEDVPDAEASAIATNGRELVIVGEEQPHDAAACANMAASVRPVAWHSSDGRTWQRSAPFEEGGTNARATAVWAVPGGWQAAVQGAVTNTISIWESADGLAWGRLGEPVAVGDVNVYAGAGPDGTVVMSRWVDTESGPRLLTSPDGLTWEPIAKAAGCEDAPGTTQIIGPAAQGLDAWILVHDMRICTSPDLESWSATTMTDAPSTVAQTRFGAILLADACFGAGTTCAPDPRAYLTTDGVTWTPMTHPPVYGARSLADGPAGVLLVGQTADDGATTVWRLDP